jgi:signal transduction histidine kinase/ActR/RegA family two-component response regulator
VILDVYRRWRSIDRKLPLLASGLVLVTALVLGWTAHILLQRALLDSAGTRLASTANMVAQSINRPRTRATDSATVAADRTLRAFLRGTGNVSPDAALAALAHTTNPRDSAKVYAALVDASGHTLLAYHRRRALEPKWPASAIAAGPMDTMSLGPIEDLGGVPTYTYLYPLRDTSVKAAPLLGYLVEGRALYGGRGIRQFRAMIGNGIDVLVGQPGVGVWTNLERIAAPPPVQSRTDTIVVFDHSVGASARVVGTNWMVWLTQPASVVLAPARTLLWSLVPLGLGIALLGALVMWRMAHRITYPIVALTAAAERIAADVRPSPADGAPASASSMPAIAPPADADEVTRLRSAFERMAARVAERETLEHQLRHSQKMEAIGRLAGGVAHDFNNLLTAIRSYADLLYEDMPVWDSKRADIQEIRTAAQRASALTAQLLAFSRKQMLQPRVLDTAAVLQDVQAMLGRLLIEDIQLSIETPPGLWHVKADRGQLEQVIVNLAVNARDAMPHGGALRISAVNDAVMDTLETSHGLIPPGEYVAIRVTDTGLGMDTMTQARVFEPFFTTKAVGQGTGLGLATVHGIVAQSGGYVTVESAVASGTTFTVYLPRVNEEPKRRDSGGDAAKQRGHNETILLVEDEQSVRALARRVLVRAGFRVLEAATPIDALRLAREHFQEIQLVLSDVVMPEMNGPEVVSKIAQLCPRARVLFISGYTDDELTGRGLANPAIQLLRKPFSAQQLVERVRAAMEGIAT